jgi:carbamoylphosphate synthase large subunit
MKKYRIGVSCVGSGVGQSVINSCRLSRLPLYTVGLGTNPFAYGAYECDCMDYTPTIYVDNYVEQLIPVLKKHRVDLVIPGLDDEALLFAKADEQFRDAGIRYISSSVELVELCRDKGRMSVDLNPILDVFVKGYDLAGAMEALQCGELDYPLIAKPRGGCASRGIEIILDEGGLARIPEHTLFRSWRFRIRMTPTTPCT